MLFKKMTKKSAKKSAGMGGGLRTRLHRKVVMPAKKKKMSQRRRRRRRRRKSYGQSPLRNHRLQDLPLLPLSLSPTKKRKASK